MHTTKIGVFRFHHNGDYSGDVVIAREPLKAGGTVVNFAEMLVPFSMLVEFVGKSLKSSMIRAVEDLESHHALAVFRPLFRKPAKRSK